MKGDDMVGCVFLGVSKGKLYMPRIIQVKNIASYMINNKGVDTFYIDSKNDFSVECGKILIQLKKEFDFIKTIYVCDKNDDIVKGLESYDNVLIYNQKFNRVERYKFIIDMCNILFFINNEQQLINVLGENIDKQSLNDLEIAIDYCLSRNVISFQL